MEKGGRGKVTHTGWIKFSSRDRGTKCDGGRVVSVPSHRSGEAI